MIHLRNATEEDFAAIAEHSVGHGLKEYRAGVDVAWAGHEDGVFCGMGGIKQMTPTAAWIWLDPTEEAIHRPVSLYRCLSDWMRITVSTYGLKLLMAAVRSDFMAGIRTVEHLGFERKCDLPGFYGESDGILYTMEVEGE